MGVKACVCVFFESGRFPYKLRLERSTHLDISFSDVIDVPRQVVQNLSLRRVFVVVKIEFARIDGAQLSQTFGQSESNLTIGGRLLYISK